MSSIHNYYMTSQLFQLVEERVASVEVEKKLRPIAAMFVRLFDEIDFNISNEMVPEALERLIFFVHKDDVTSTVEFAHIEKFYTNDEDQLFALVKGEEYQVVEPAVIENDEPFEIDDEEEGVAYEENETISLEDDESYIVIDGDEVVEEYELNEEITLDDDESYLIIDDNEDEISSDEFDYSLTFDVRPIYLDNAHAELITLAATTDLDELIEEQIDDLPAFKEIIDQLEVIRKEVKKKAKLKESKKSKKQKKDKKDLTEKIAKKLHKYVVEKELEQQLLIEFVELKKQIDFIVIQY